MKEQRDMMGATTSTTMGSNFDLNGMVGGGDGSGNSSRLISFQGTRCAGGGGSLGMIILVSVASGFLSSFASLFLFFHYFVWDEGR